MKPRWRGLAALAAACASLAVPVEALAASQLYKCVEGGRTVYQQQACPVSAVETPASAAKAEAASVAAARKLKPAAAPASAAPATRR